MYFLNGGRHGNKRSGICGSIITGGAKIFREYDVLQSFGYCSIPIFHQCGAVLLGRSSLQDRLAVRHLPLQVPDA